MKKTVLLLISGLFLISCGDLSFFKKPENIQQPTQPTVEENKQEEIVVKLGNKRTEMIILQELLSQGEIIDRDVHVRKTFKNNQDGSYEPVTTSTEYWIIQTGEDFHLAVFEQGILVRIEPAKNLETAHKMVKPYGKFK